MCDPASATSPACSKVPRNTRNVPTHTHTHSTHTIPQQHHSRSTRTTEKRRSATPFAGFSFAPDKIIATSYPSKRIHPVKYLLSVHPRGSLPRVIRSTSITAIQPANSAVRRRRCQRLAFPTTTQPPCPPPTSASQEKVPLKPCTLERFQTGCTRTVG